MHATARQTSMQNHALDVMVLWATEVPAVSGCVQWLNEDTHGALPCSASE